MIPDTASNGDPITAFIESWIEQVRDGDFETHLHLPFSNATDGVDLMSHTPSPTKRQKRSRGQPVDADADATPKAPALISDAASDATSNTTTSVSDISNGSSSPQKRELALRFAEDRPLVREHVQYFKDPTPLMKDLAKIETEAFIPATVKDLMTRESGWAYLPKEDWFYTHKQGPLSDDVLLDDKYMFRRLKALRDKTNLCKKRREPEAAWNSGVHEPLLEAALEDVRGITYRNITSCRVLAPFRDPDLFVTDAKVDFGIFLDPTAGNANPQLADRIAAYQRPDRRGRLVCPVQLPDGAQTPVVIPIETKSAVSDREQLGPVQLATWTRAHLRLLDGLPSAGTPPILPVIFVHGALWRVDFAQATKDKLIIWEGFDMGLSDNLRGCYKIVAFLRCLATWALKEYSDWFEAALTE